MISNGNFHPVQLAIGFDALRVALAHVALLSERRLNRLAPHTFGSPDDAPGPAERPVGLELSSYAAAALVAEVRYLAAPATLDCPPLDLGTEDHATLAVTTVRRTREALTNLETLIWIEVLHAADKLDLAEPVPNLGAGTSVLFNLARRVRATLPRGATVGQLIEPLRAAYWSSTGTAPELAKLG
jgi:histidine ammonia-lyase